MSRNILTGASFVIIFLFARSGYSQETPCKVSSLRGAVSPAGAEGTMVVVNNGRACEFAVYENPRSGVTPGLKARSRFHPRTAKSS